MVDETSTEATSDATEGPAAAISLPSGELPATESQPALRIMKIVSDCNHWHDIFLPYPVAGSSALLGLLLLPSVSSSQLILHYLFS